MKIIRQFFAAHEQHKANGCQKNNCQIFPGMTWHLSCLRQQDREKCEGQANDFEQ